MPFKNYEELITMSKSDPKMARFLVSKAKRSNSPVVDEENPGYDRPKRSESMSGTKYQAIVKRQKRPSTGVRKEYEQAISNRLKSMYDRDQEPRSREDKIVTQRKKVGY